MAITVSDCGAVILAGGRSRRMGTCKALLPWRDGVLIQHIAGQLRVFDEIWVSTGDPEVKAAVPLPWVEDIFFDAGPLAGLHAALCATRKEYLLCVPCDLPNFREAAAQLLLRNMGGDLQALVCRDQTGRIHPLCGIYSKSVLPILREQLDSGQYRVRAFLDRLRWETLDTAPMLPDDIYYNVNTPQAYQSLLEPIR